MKTKRIIACIISCGIVGSSYISVEAKVIDPVLVKSETWGGTYYVSDGLEEYQGEYPYLTYKADIYSDATIELTIYNNHEWNSFVYDPSVYVSFGFEDIGHSKQDSDICNCFTEYFQNIIGTVEWSNFKELCESEQKSFRSLNDVHAYIEAHTPIKDDSETTVEKYMNKTVSLVKNVSSIKKLSFEKDLQFSNISGYRVHNSKMLMYCPDDEKESAFNSGIAHVKESIHIHCDYVDTQGKLFGDHNEENDLFYMEYYKVPSYNGLLGNLPVGEDNPLYTYTLYPEKYPKDETSIIIAGHTITIIPELLNSDAVAQNKDPRDVYIEQLESQVSYLQEQLSTSTATTANIAEITYNNGSSSIQFKTDIDISGIQNYIDKLEAENATLRQENTELKNRINLLSTGTYGDVNGDNAVDIQDAQIILAYYTQKDVAMMDVPDLVTFGLNFGKG